MKNLHAFSSKEKGLRHYFATYSIGGDYQKRVETKLELVFRKHVSVGFKFHIGDRGSETPVDVMLSVGFFAAFWSLDFPGLGRLCEKIGRGHKRNLSLTFHNRMMWWELWYDDEDSNTDWHRCGSWRKPKLWPWSMGRKKHRGWMCLRKGNLELNPLDAFWGNRYFAYEDLEETDTYVAPDQFVGDVHRVHFTLQKVTCSRRYGPKWARRISDEGWVADWDCEKGIPVRNHDWKGDNVYASDVKVSSDGPGWVDEAANALVEQIKKDRAHYNYVPPRVEEK